MQLLICAATEMEIRPTMELVADMPEVEVLITGVGLTAATYALTKAVYTKRPDFILQAGVAGCLDLSLPLTKIVLVEHETIGDLGVEEGGKFRSVADLKLQNADAFPWRGGKLSNDVALLRQTGLTLVSGVTVNEVSTRADRIAYYRDQLGAQIETMEGAALHYVGLLEKLPFLQLRSLSNFAGERDKTKWVMDMAVTTLNIELQRILSKMNQ
jgi:futalosine hydrolase